MSKTKTSIKIILEDDGRCKYKQTWSNFALKTGNHPVETSELMVLKLINLPEYRWLEKLVLPHLEEKYCKNCVHGLNIKVDEEKETSCRDSNSVEDVPFPYCFKKCEAK